MTDFNLENSLDNIEVVEDVLSKEDHQILLDYVSTIDGWQTQPWGVQFFNHEKGLLPEIADILDKALRIAFQRCEDKHNVKLRVFEKREVHIVKFKSDYSMNKHVDTAGDFAVIYYINDNYDGGEINFPWHDLKVKPKANSFITFPSNQHYLHEVLKNTGDRYSSPLWFNFEGSPYRGDINEKEGTDKTVQY